MKTRIQRHLRQVIHIERLMWLLKRPVFWRLTILVHGLIFLAATAFYQLEAGVNPRLESMTDAFYWAITTATTVGYGDIVTITPMGKWLAMGLMVGGTLVSALYTAFFAAALMKPEIDEMERELAKEEKLVDALMRRLEELSARK